MPKSTACVGPQHRGKSWPTAAASATMRSQAKNLAVDCTSGMYRAVSASVTKARSVRSGRSDPVCPPEATCHATRIAFDSARTSTRVDMPHSVMAQPTPMSWMPRALPMDSEETQAKISNVYPNSGLASTATTWTKSKRRSKTEVTFDDLDVALPSLRSAIRCKTRNKMERAPSQENVDADWEVAACSRATISSAPSSSCILPCSGRPMLAVWG